MNRTEILEKIDDPRQLEKLYRDNKVAFKTEFNRLYPTLPGNKIADYWHERLNYESPEISWGSSRELVFVTIASLLAGLLAKLPDFLNLDPEQFYMKNIGFIVFTMLTAYFIWRNGLSVQKMNLAGLLTLGALVFINMLPQNNKSDTQLLSCIHLPFFLWAIWGFTYLGNNARDYNKRLEFLRYNGDLVIMTTLILISGAILTGITIGLFAVIGLHIEKFYGEYIGIFGLAAAPIVGSYIIQVNPQLVNKVSPIIAKVFSPLVLIMLVVYLVAIPFSGENPYQDREFLLIFNALLIGVMAIILFSVAETSRKNANRTGNYILLALSIVTVIVNCIALSAIMFRISEWGITPNRLAVMGSNMLILANLLVVTYRLFKHVSKKEGIEKVENSISMFLPVYVVWTIVVIFIFPLVFHFN